LQQLIAYLDRIEGRDLAERLAESVKQVATTV
jgi:hypothetical protein